MNLFQKERELRDDIGIPIGGTGGGAAASQEIGGMGAARYGNWGQRQEGDYPEFEILGDEEQPVN